MKNKRVTKNCMEAVRVLQTEGREGHREGKVDLDVGWK